MGLVSKKVYSILAVVFAAVMLLGLVSFAAVEGGLGNLPRELGIGSTAVSAAAAVFAARRGWKPSTSPPRSPRRALRRGSKSTKIISSESNSLKKCF